MTKMDFSVISEKEARAKLDAAREGGDLKETIKIVADLCDTTRDNVAAWYYDTAGTTEPARVFDESILKLAATEYAKHVISIATNNGAPEWAAEIARNLVMKGVLSNKNDTLTALDYLVANASEEVDEVEKLLEGLKKRHAEACRIYTNANEIAEAYKEELENE